MPESPPENRFLLNKGDIVNVGIDLPDKTFAEDVATVIAAEHDEILLNLCGSGFPAHLPISRGSKVHISYGNDRAVFQGTALLTSHLAGSSLGIELPQKVIVKARREHMRADVMIQVHYYMPTSQNMGRVISEWECLKACGDNCTENFIPAYPERNCRVNLSGSGLRFKICDCLSYGTLLHLKITLPEAVSGHIHAVGSIVRTKELSSDTAHMEYYSTSMTFRMIDSSDRQKLIRYILDEQHRRIDEAPSKYL